ncbi:MAG: hypothetical protein M1839_006241 [Geoglossum umbratile]|nr:MAG: hypothetical protein M1839_006241 [Geoglossum umbratile]
MHIILTGATGTIGSAVLTHLLASPNVSRLSILTRTIFDLPTSDSNGNSFDLEKAKVIEHKDYLSYPDELLKGKLAGAEACIWAQGISQSEVGEDRAVRCGVQGVRLMQGAGREYVHITHDFPLAAARAFATLPLPGGRFNFVYVSGEGADQTEKSMLLFGRIKGRAERALLALPASGLSLTSLRIYNVRPGYVYPAASHRSRRFLLKIADAVIAPIMMQLAPGRMSPTGELAKVLADLAIGDGEPLPAGTGVEDEGRLLRNVGIRRLGKEAEGEAR